MRILESTLRSISLVSVDTVDSSWHLSQMAPFSWTFRLSTWWHLTHSYGKLWAMWCWCGSLSGARCKIAWLWSSWWHTQTHTHPFNGPFSGTTQVSRYQKGKTNLDFTEARDTEWQWHQLVPYASLHLAPDRWPSQHPTTQFFTGRMPFLPPNQQRQSTEGTRTDDTASQNPINSCYI